MKRLATTKKLPRFAHGEITHAIRSLKVGQSFIAPQPRDNSVYTAAHKLGVKVKREEIEHGLLRVTRIR